MQRALRTVTVVAMLGLAGCGEGAAERSSVSSPSAAATSLGPSTAPVVDPHGSVPIGQPFQIEVGTHCGVGVLGLLVNGISWTTDSAEGQRDWMPSEWAVGLAPGEELIALEVVLSDDDTLTASAMGRSVAYRPMGADDPEFFCA